MKNKRTKPRSCLACAIEVPLYDPLVPPLVLVLPHRLRHWPWEAAALPHLIPKPRRARRPMTSPRRQLIRACLFKGDHHRRTKDPSQVPLNSSPLQYSQSIDHSSPVQNLTRTTNQAITTCNPPTPLTPPNNTTTHQNVLPPRTLRRPPRPPPRPLPRPSPPNHHHRPARRLLHRLAPAKDGRRLGQGHAQDGRPRRQRQARRWH